MSRSEANLNPHFTYYNGNLRTMAERDNPWLDFYETTSVTAVVVVVNYNNDRKQLF